MIRLTMLVLTALVSSRTLSRDTLAEPPEGWVELTYGFDQFTTFAPPGNRFTRSSSATINGVRMSVGVSEIRNDEGNTALLFLEVPPVVRK